MSGRAVGMWWAVLAILVVEVSASACARAHAKTEPEAPPPPLDMPAPPPRDVQTSDTEVPVPTPPTEEPARRVPSTAPVPARPRPAAPARPEPAPVELPKPTDEPAKPTTTLQTAPTGTEGEIERAIRSLLTRATTDLNRIDYRALNADARTQYDTAKRFVAQAQVALREKNLVFAKNLADKAAALAAQLAGK